MATHNPSVTTFLDALNHPLRQEIQLLRDHILRARPDLEEDIKWNGPNYTHAGNDRITMKIQPPGKVQLIFHLGAKVRHPASSRRIEDPSGLLAWRGNDRAIATFESMEEIDSARSALQKIVDDWIRASQ